MTNNCNMNKIKLGKCPYCDSTNYYEEISQIVTEFDNPYIVMDADCNNCHKEFTTYYSQDEVKFDKDGEEFIFNNCLSKEERQIILKAINLLIEQEGDNKDYTRIINIMKGELNNE